MQIIQKRMFGIFRMNEDESSMVITLMVMKAPEYCIRSYRHFDTAHTRTFSRVLRNRFESIITRSLYRYCNGWKVATRSW